MVSISLGLVFYSAEMMRGQWAGSVFSEYYAPDGTIKAEGYTGKWRATDGAMCFQYGDTPERCFDVSIDGPSMVMYMEGKIDGNGMLIPGNPNGF